MKNMKVVSAVLVACALVGGVLFFQMSSQANVDGDWDCKAEWTYSDDGVDVPISHVAKIHGADGQVSAEAVLSIGEARWKESTRGTFTVDGDRFCETRTHLTSIPQNDAARQFEEKQLQEGKTLFSDVKLPLHMPCSRLKQPSPNVITAVNEEGRTINCKRI